MQQFGRSGARGAALRGNGWRESEKFSVKAMARSAPKFARENRLRAAIRRIQMTKEGDSKSMEET